MMPMEKPTRVVALLAACQAALLTNNIILVGLNGLVGYSLLGTDKSLATLPVTAYVLGTACITVPASLWMKRVGRRAGFITGAMIGVIGALVGAFAVFSGSFWLLCVGTLLMGGYNAFGQYYRFAAAEIAGAAFRSRAISLVLAGGVVGAVAGPETSKLTKDLLSAPFTGTYLFLVGLATVALILQAFVVIPTVAEDEHKREARPLAVIARQGNFILAVMSSMFGYASMNFLMTAAPIAMVQHHHAYSDAAFVIEWHALAMFAPSFVTGSLVKRFGNIPILQIGAGLILLCIAIATYGGLSVAAFWISLVLLGVGWNFLYVGGSTLLTETYAPSERAKAQATHDQFVFLATALSSVGSGWLLQKVGWPAMALWSLPLPLVVLMATALPSWQDRVGISGSVKTLE
ncbi:putative MFS family arabinose efflux permease [Bradyrhizobium sp. LB8.2]|uniref:MFS transporter n=1 Tax=unclassified Bradyrhizobium TaxID=2631580 RepID=UPI003399857D